MSEVVKTIKLSKPVEDGEKVITEINLKKLTAGHFWGLDLQKLEFGSYLTVAANASGLHLNVMKKLEMKDAMAVATYVGECLADGPEIGSAPSA